MRGAVACARVATSSPPPSSIPPSELPVRVGEAPVARAAAPTLTGARLILVPMQARDAQEMRAVLAAPELYGFTGGTPPTLADLQRRFEAQSAGSPEAGVTWHNWIIRLVEGRVAVGFVQATVSADTADIAWLVGVSWQRQGIATEATLAMCDWLAGQGVQCLVAHIHPDHVASARVAEAAGLTPTDGFDADGEAIWTDRT